MHDAPAMIGRRTFLAASGAALLSGCVGSRPITPQPEDERVRLLAALEKASGGRLGAAVLDTGSGASFGWRMEERFCHCSSFKLSLAALVLREGAAGRISLSEELRFDEKDLLANSPVTRASLARGALPIVELARATQVTSDNAAANLLMRRLGGPQVLTRFWRELGDPVSRLDAYEPELNRIPPGTQENSTTPAAMARTLASILYGNVLSATDAARLRGWMSETRTGAARIRAGLPGNWTAGDKTGTAVPDQGPGNYVDVAFAQSPGRAPLIITGYFEDFIPGGGETRPQAEAVLASLGRIVAGAVSGRP